MPAEPTFSPPPGEAEVVDRLRAAGCVFAEDEARLLIAEASSPADLASMVGRRIDGEPLEHIVGWTEFRGLRIAVASGVFVPRRRTGFLVDRAIAVAAPPLIAVDLCCGSGAVGAALAAALAGVELHAADIDPAAVACARRNLHVVGGRAYVGDLFAPLPPGLRGRVDLLLVNAPYVPTDAIAMMPPEARDHEPRAALDGGGDGLDVHRRVISQAPRWLARGGRLLIETGRRQADVAARLMAVAGLEPTIETSTELGATVVTGELRADRGHRSAAGRRPATVARTTVPERGRPRSRR